MHIYRLKNKRFRFGLILTTVAFEIVEEYLDWELAKALQEMENKKSQGADDDDDDNDPNSNKNKNPPKNFDDFVDFDDLDAVDNTEQEIRKKVYSTFDLKKFFTYLWSEKKYDEDKILNEIVDRQECAQCMECESPSCFLTSFVSQYFHTPAKAFITNHLDRLHGHVRTELEYVFNDFFIAFC